MGFQETIENVGRVIDAIGSPMNTASSGGFSAAPSCWGSNFSSLPTSSERSL